MISFLAKLKKIGFYSFFAIGILVVAWFVLASGLQATRRVSYNNYSGGMLQNPLSGPSLPAAPFQNLSGAPSFDLGLPDLFPTSRKEAGGGVAPSAAKAAEGTLVKRKIVKNGSLSILVGKAEAAAESIQKIAADLGGFVADSRVYEVSEGTKSGAVTIRVPSDKFSEAVAAIKKLAVKVEQETVSASDVTDQFVDLEAQLKNLRAQETQYLEIMKRAGTIQDTLNVAAQLNNVQGSIERMQGQLQYLAAQVDMSTITVSITSEADIQVFGISWRPLFVIKQSFRNMLSGLSGYIDSMIGFLFNLPVYLLWIATIVFFGILGWKVILWLKNRFFPKDRA